ncbi:ABC transporter permease [candidate division KSB1 bacterium]
MKRTNVPPGSGLWLLKRILPEGEKHHLINGIIESFDTRLREKGRFSALTWFWKDVILSIPHIIKDNFFMNSMMFGSYLKIAFRTLKRQKINTIVNITGLSIAISFCFLVLLLANHEFSYDRFHTDTDKIYSIVATNHYFDATMRGLCYPAAPAVKDNFPEIDDFVRIRYNMRGLMKYGGRVFEEEYTLVDEQFFEFFTFPLLSGNPESVLKSDNSVVLTESAAEKFFGSEDPVGKTVSIEYRTIHKDFIVTGIAEDPPVNSSIRFNVLFNISNLDSYYSRIGFTDRLWAVDWSNLSFFKIRDDIDPGSIEGKIDRFINENYERAAPERVAERRGAGHSTTEGFMWTIGFQNIKDVHFSPDIGGLYYMNDIENIWFLGGIALLILFIALINYLNLFIGSSSARSLEIGLRKVMGADKKRMVYQFNVESLIITLLAFLTGLIIVFFTLPLFNRLLNSQLEISDLLLFSNNFYPDSCIHIR